MAKRKVNLQKIKAELLTRRDGLEQDLHRTTTNLLTEDMAYSDAIDQANAVIDRTLELEIRTRGNQVLRDIRTALRRIDDGSFGICEDCGEEIAAARMKANPATTLCIDCKVELESEQTRFVGRL